MGSGKRTIHRYSRLEEGLWLVDTELVMTELAGRNQTPSDRHISTSSISMAEWSTATDLHS
jgi:hypothetical protein